MCCAFLFRYCSSHCFAGEYIQLLTIAAPLKRTVHRCRNVSAITKYIDCALTSQQVPSGGRRVMLEQILLRMLPVPEGRPRPA